MPIDWDPVGLEADQSRQYPTGCLTQPSPESAVLDPIESVAGSICPHHSDPKSDFVAALNLQVYAFEQNPIGKLKGQILSAQDLFA